MDTLSLNEEDTDVYSSIYRNYLRLIETIKHLENNVRITEDWYEEHKQHILKYREMFPNFRYINEEFEDSEFRKKAEETETILSSLTHEIKIKKIFNLKLYLLLNKHLRRMCDIIYGEEELTDMLNQLSMHD